MNKSGKDLANSTGNAAGAIVKAGEDTVKKYLLDSVIPPKASQNHRNRTVHIARPSLDLLYIFYVFGIDIDEDLKSLQFDYIP